MGNKLDQPDLEIANIAARQLGVVTYRQLLEAGLCPSGVVTTPARTIEDLEGEVAPYLVRRATRQAETTTTTAVASPSGTTTRGTWSYGNAVSLSIASAKSR
jgi:hypothetical protein